MRIFFSTFFIIFFLTTTAFSDEASDWLNKEIDIILDAYKNENISNEKRFLMIEDTINSNFAGAGIAKFVAGNSWLNANKKIKKEYILLFKRHLALNITSMMKGYSSQRYELTNIKFDSKNKVSLIDMEIFSNTGSLVITWRVKKSKNRFYIIDLLIADISLVVTKRSDFNSMLKGVDNDLEKLNILLSNQNKDSFKKIVK
jgi:ABC-type transporter MlaC component